MEKTSIAIGLHLNDRVIDLRIPREVSVERLKILLVQALNANKIDLPHDFSLKVLNKPLRLTANNLLADYPLGDGDQIAVIAHMK